MTAALEVGEWSATRPGRTLPLGKTRYPLYRRLGGPQGQSGRAQHPVPTGIRSQTVQPVVSRYTECDVSECDFETSTYEELRLTRGLWSHEKRTHCSLPKTDNWVPHKIDFRHLFFKLRGEKKLNLMFLCAGPGGSAV